MNKNEKKKKYFSSRSFVFFCGTGSIFDSSRLSQTKAYVNHYCSICKPKMKRSSEVSQTCQPKAIGSLHIEVMSQNHKGETADSKIRKITRKEN
jgi:hypothetical protein